jgi:SAM-dependent methyltransferase
MMKEQIEASAYKFERYVSPDRWASYYYQLYEIFATRPSSVLEIGLGDGTIGNAVRHDGIAYTSADIAEDLHPDIVAPVTKIPFPDEAFDTVCAFEVLEHLPFSEFEPALAELSRVSRSYVILSLPHFGPSIRMEFKIPFLPRTRFACKIPFPRRHSFNGQHHWEIGKSGHSLRNVKNILKKYFRIGKEFVPFENQYHHFFVLQKKS